MPGKTEKEREAARIKAEASMGPRQDAGEDLVKDVRNFVKTERFNGAPAGCRGRHFVSCNTGSHYGTLQWGPGRMPGKT